MGFWQKLGEVPKWFWHQLVSTWKSEEAKTLETIKSLAIPLIESVGKIDLNGDGKVANIKEVLDVAEKYGVAWGKKLLANGKEDAENKLKGYFDHDLQKYIAMAKLTTTIVNKLGAEKLPPKARMFGGMVEVVLNQLLDEPSVKK